MWQSLCFGCCNNCNSNTVVVMIGGGFSGDAICESCDWTRYNALYPKGNWMVWRSRLENMEAPLTPAVMSVLSREPFTPAFQAVAGKKVKPLVVRRRHIPKRRVSQPSRQAVSVNG
jgi:hypothetical protein